LDMAISSIDTFVPDYNKVSPVQIDIV